MVEQSRSGAYTQIVCAPTGEKLALMNGQTLQKAFVPLPGKATAVYSSTGLRYYRHADWLGSARLASTPSRTVYSTTAYAPFGETYAQSGTSDPSFTGMNQDGVGGLYDFLFREYSTQGRCPACGTDPLGGSVVNPQLLNRYTYVLNSPVNLIDPLGLDTECVTVTIGGTSQTTCTENPNFFLLSLIWTSLFRPAALDFLKRFADDTREPNRHQPPPPAPQQPPTQQPANGCPTPGLSPTTLGLAATGTAAGGAGQAGGSVATGSAGFAVSPTTGATGIFASGGTATATGSSATGAPQQAPGTATAAGAFAGGGLTIILSNGQPSQLRGPFSTISLAAGTGLFSLSVEFSSGARGVYQIGLGFIPGASVGVGFQFSGLRTNTAVIATGCKSP